MCFLLLPLFKPDSQTGLYVAVMFLMCLGMSTYDTTTDGMSIDTTVPADRGLVQGLMVGGRALAVAITGTLMGIFSNAGNWNAIFYLASLLALAMEFSDPRIADFMFAVIMTVGDLAIATGSAVAGGVVDAFGFRAV